MEDQRGSYRSNGGGGAAGSHAPQSPQEEHQQRSHHSPTASRAAYAPGYVTASPAGSNGGGVAATRGYYHPSGADDEAAGPSRYAAPYASRAEASDEARYRQQQQQQQLELEQMRRYEGEAAGRQAWQQEEEWRRREWNARRAAEEEAAAVARAEEQRWAAQRASEAGDVHASYQHPSYRSRSPEERVVMPPAPRRSYEAASPTAPASSEEAQSKPSMSISSLLGGSAQRSQSPAARSFNGGAVRATSAFAPPVSPAAAGVAARYPATAGGYHPDAPHSPPVRSTSGFAHILAEEEPPRLPQHSPVRSAPRSADVPEETRAVLPPQPSSAAPRTRDTRMDVSSLASQRTQPAAAAELPVPPPPIVLPAATAVPPPTIPAPVNLNGSALNDLYPADEPLTEEDEEPPAPKAAAPKRRVKVVRSRPSRAKKPAAAAAPVPAPEAPMSEDEGLPAWDSDLETENNKARWQPSLEAYKLELADRLACLETAFEDDLILKEQQVGLRLSKAYAMRHAAVMRRVEQRERTEQKQREARQRNRRELVRKHAREKELEAELLGTIDDSGHRGDAYDHKKLDSASMARKRKIEDLAAAAAEEAYPEDSFYGEEEEREDLGSRASTPAVEPEPLAEGIIPIDGRREQMLIDAHRKVWLQIARRDVPKVYRHVVASNANKTGYWRRISSVVQREAKRGSMRNIRTGKDVQLRARKVMREMLVFWKRNEKEEKELRRRAEKEAFDRAKKEEEMREAKRQARKLNFLITQTELYSHFVGNKLKTSEAEDSAETSGGNAAPAAANIPAAAAEPAVEGELAELDFDNDDESNLRAHARRNAEEAVKAAKQKAQAFDASVAEGQQQAAASAAAKAAANGETASGHTAAAALAQGDLGKAFDSDDLNFNNPTSMGQMDLKQPKMLTCSLKDYQLKGLNWLANLYEQGINGILADEMGLGKTVQSISLIAYLAEVHNIWGPFLVIAPASTLHNWQQEIEKFVPTLKALPYWGSVKERALLRKFWSKKQLNYSRDSPFHVVVTSYQLVVSDEQYFKRVRWQYMVLDEAQAIKSSSSNRWKTLLSFDCRNRLLLTGTPVQNSMQELWALLHFIMPSLFDSHDEFSEWFSKDIESAAGGEKSGQLNEHQLRRLHMILKPFMLRRIKKNVQNELGDKIEIDVFCEMSARQRTLYRGLRERVSVAELMDKATSTDESGMKHLMNLVMQFRKVCNHPELFERADVEAPFACARFAQSGGLSREGDVLDCPDSTASLIEFNIPKLLCREGGILGIPGDHSRAGFDTQHLGNLFNIWRTEHVHRSLDKPHSAFAALKMLDLTPADAEQTFHAGGTRQVLAAVDTERHIKEHASLMLDDEFAAASTRPFGLVRKPMPGTSNQPPSVLLPLDSIVEDYSSRSLLAKPGARILGAPATAPPIQLVCNDGPFTQSQQRLRRNESISQMLYGLTPAERESEEALEAARLRLPGLPPRGLINTSARDQLPGSEMQIPQMHKLIIDSTKLAHLDELLTKLKSEGHRVLIYFQMTKMIDLMEEYLIYRKHKYLRLDGSSKISDRRDMVTDWQTKPELFVFLLSTRAGGLGINLTAADTVIFYDHDWNPSNDSQAMDRAHRLGQTKQVTVYRLITKNTIDERIVKLARNKKEVQDIVVGTKAYSETGMAKPQEIVSLLLDDDELAHSMLMRKQAEEAMYAQGKADAARHMHAKRRLNRANAAKASPAPGPAWALDDDEDDFFGAKPTSKNEDDDGTTKAKGAEPKKRIRKAKPKTDDANGAAADGAPAKPKRRSQKKAAPAAGLDDVDMADGGA